MSNSHSQGMLDKIINSIKTILLDDDYKIDDQLEWSEQLNIYILRYRRIIGIFMLIILLYLLNYCDNLGFGAIKQVNQRGGAGIIAKGISSVAASGAAQNAIAGAANNKPKHLAEELKGMKTAGMTKIDITKHLGGQAMRFGKEKAFEFANWLYEILFALAISIAICMVVVPSISFFALGLVCYFLLRKKMVAIKSF